MENPRRSASRPISGERLALLDDEIDRRPLQIDPGTSRGAAQRGVAETEHWGNSLDSEEQT
jgi:hypothetical protein